MAVIAKEKLEYKIVCWGRYVEVHNLSKIEENSHAEAQRHRGRQEKINRGETEFHGYRTEGRKYKKSS
jgi:hypothetical protein